MNAKTVQFKVDLDDRNSVRDAIILLDKNTKLLTKRWKRMEVKVNKRKDNGTKTKYR